MSYYKRDIEDALGIRLYCINSFSYTQDVPKVPRAFSARQGMVLFQIVRPDLEKTKKTLAPSRLVQKELAKKTLAP